MAMTIQKTRLSPTTNSVEALTITVVGPPVMRSTVTKHRAGLMRGIKYGSSGGVMDQALFSESI